MRFVSGASRRDLKRLLDDVKRQGWDVSLTNGGHWRLRHPGGAVVYSPTTPSCGRGMKNLQADIRRVERQQRTGGDSHGR